MRLADKPVNTLRVPAFRAEHFPSSGPFPWLDRELPPTGRGAELCRKSIADGYVILNGPVGYLAAAWIVFEDIGPDCGGWLNNMDLSRITFMPGKATC